MEIFIFNLKNNSFIAQYLAIFRATNHFYLLLSASLKQAHAAVKEGKSSFQKVDIIFRECLYCVLLFQGVKGGNQPKTTIIAAIDIYFLTNKVKVFVLA